MSKDMHAKWLTCVDTARVYKVCQYCFNCDSTKNVFKKLKSNTFCLRSDLRTTKLETKEGNVTKWNNINKNTNKVLKRSRRNFLV